MNCKGNVQYKQWQYLFKNLNSIHFYTLMCPTESSLHYYNTGFPLGTKEMGGKGKLGSRNNWEETSLLSKTKAACPRGNHMILSDLLNGLISRFSLHKILHPIILGYCLKFLSLKKVCMCACACVYTVYNIHTVLYITIRIILVSIPVIINVF